MPAEGSEPEAPEGITLIDESGRARGFRMHDAFELEGATYYLVEGADDPDEVLLLCETEAGLRTVDADEFQRVMNALEHDEVE